MECLSFTFWRHLINYKFDGLQTTTSAYSQFQATVYYGAKLVQGAHNRFGDRHVEGYSRFLGAAGCLGSLGELPSVQKLPQILPGKKTAAETCSRRAKLFGGQLCLEVHAREERRPLLLLLRLLHLSVPELAGGTLAGRARRRSGSLGHRRKVFEIEDGNSKSN